MWPRRRASHMKTMVAIVPASTVKRLASGPNAPPLSTVGPDITPCSSPCGVLLPETSVPKIAPSA
jgi:hypothetical protein